MIILAYKKVFWISVNKYSRLFPIKINLYVFSQSPETDSVETQAELVVLRTYVENQAIVQPILLYRASNCKQTKEQGSKDCTWTHIFTFL